MNKKSVILKSIALTSIFVLNVGLLVNLNRVAIELDAYSISSLPTTIDLNDCTNEQIRTYYSGLNSLDDSERQGTNLLKNLKTILKNGQKYLSYDSGNSIWDAYCIVDRDWNKSPASALPAAAGTYNAETNKITNYHWGGNDDTYENPYLHILYYNRNLEPVAKAYGNHGNGKGDPKGINREHIWPKGAGFDTKAQGGARGDLMHLWAAHGHTNNKHSNFYYGYVDQTRSFEDEKTDTPQCAGNLLGTSKTLGGTTKVFEPQDSDKGDIARACFYMVARYNDYAGTDSIDSNNPNLELVNELSSWQSGGYTSSSSRTGKLGIVQDLLEWNRLDPPDEFEIHRNNLCYRNFTNNRNPFIDFPSWADAIWGTVDQNGNYDNTPSGKASPSTDPINTSSGGTSEVFSISTTNLSLKVNDTAQIYGKNAESTITWSVEDNTVVSLSTTTTTNNEKVTITALKDGSTTITATSGGNSINCAVTVSSDVNYGTPNNPLSVDKAISVISLTGENLTPQPVTVRGIVSSASYSEKYSNFNYVWLKSDDGKTEQAFELYHTELDEELFDEYSNNEALIGKEIVARGFGKHYNSNTYELCESTKDPKKPVILSVTGSKIDDYLNNTSPYLDLLADEKDTRQDYENWKTFEELNLTDASDITSFDFEKSVVTFAQGEGANHPKYYNSDLSARVYKDNTITFTSSITINRIIFTFVSGYDTGLSTATGTYVTGEWNGEASEVVFNVSGKVRITQIYIATTGGGLIVDDVAIRFGLVVPKEDWNAIHQKWPISDYGVMLVKKETLNETYGYDTVAEAYANGEYLLDLHKKTYAEPFSLNENNYVFTVKLKMTLISNYDVTYCAAPYIVAGGTYYFLDQIETSVNDLASDLLKSGKSSLSDEALTLLSTLH